MKRVPIRSTSHYTLELVKFGNHIVIKLFLFLSILLDSKSPITYTFHIPHYFRHFLIFIEILMILIFRLKNGLFVFYCLGDGPGNNFFICRCPNIFLDFYCILFIFNKFDSIINKVSLEKASFYNT